MARKAVGTSVATTPPPRFKKTVDGDFAMSSSSTSNNSPLVVERSPSNRAKCQGCGQPIIKGEGRIGTPYRFTIGNHAWNKHRYYHEQCCPSSEMTKLFPESDNVQEALKKQLRAIDKKKEQEEKIVHETRAELRKRLQKLRLQLFEAQAEKGGSAIILSLKVIDNIVLAMPETEQELGKVKGIGPTILTEYGKPLLNEVRLFHKEGHGGGGGGLGRT
jgi:HRDC domain